MLVNMEPLVLYVLLLSASASARLSEFTDDDFEDIADIHENRMSDQIRTLLDHYKQPDPVGIPGAPIPDPMALPKLKKGLPFGTLTMTNTTVQGLSKFRIEQLESNLANMKVEIGLSYAKLEILGNYSISSMLSRSAGGFNVTLVDVYFEGQANLAVARHGNLEATDIALDITFNDISMDFRNLRLVALVLQGVMNRMGTVVFDAIKPFILSEVNTNIRGDINKNLRSFKQTFPNSIPPLDLAIAEGRKYVRENGFDPFKANDYTYSAGLFSVQVSNIWVWGLASFYRVGNVTVLVKNNTLEVGLHMATKKLEGKCDWELTFASLISKYGSSGFSTEYLQIHTEIQQTLDIRNKPRIRKLELKLGNVQLRMDGTGTMDYVMELLANVLPNILRYQIVDAVEGILKQRVQEQMDAQEIERLVERHLDQLDELTSPNKTMETEIFLDPPENMLEIDEDYKDITV